MSIQTKRKIIPNVNGTDQLFSVGEDYIQGSLWTFVVDPTGFTILEPNTYFAGGYFQLAAAPAAGHSIYCIYDVTVVDAVDPNNFSLDGVTVDNIVALIKILKNQQDTMTVMDQAIQNRITVTDFTKFTDKVNQQLVNIASTRVLGSNG